MDEGILRLIEGMEGVIDCRAYTFVDSRVGKQLTTHSPNISSFSSSAFSASSWHNPYTPHTLLA